MVDPGASLVEFQIVNRQIYSEGNDRNYSIAELFSRLHRHITQVLKAVRKEEYPNVGYHLSMCLSWSFAIANRIHINIADKMWEFFPGFCPYCLSVPCACRKRAKDRKKFQRKSNGQAPISLLEWQAMFGRIYPNLVINSAIHLAEEAGEVGEAIRNYSETHNEDWFKKIVEELVDVITHILGVANHLDPRIDLAAELSGYFATGCPKCNRCPCGCGYVALDEPISLSKTKGKIAK